MRASHRIPPLFDPVRAAFFGTIVALGVLVGAATAKGAPSPPVTGALILAGAAIVLSLTPKILFLGWFAAAPFFQNSASVTTVGHAFWLAVYLAPSLVFAI